MIDMNYSTLIVEEKQGILTITFNRIAARNSINYELLLELNQAFDYAQEKKEIQLVLLQGQNGLFCTGMDFAEVASSGADTAQSSIEENMTQVYMDTLKRMSLFSKVIISCVDGQVLAGGMGLVACSDLVIATPRSTFGLSEALWGLLPAMVIPYLIRKIGPRKAYYLTLTTIVIGSEEAQNMDLVDVVTENINQSVMRYYQKLRRLEESTIANMKEYFRKMWIIDNQMEQAAVERISSLVAEPVVKENIYNFVNFRKFPWEKE